MRTVEDIARIVAQNPNNDMMISYEEYPHVEWWSEDDSLSCVSFFNNGVISVLKGKRGKSLYNARLTSIEELPAALQALGIIESSETE